MLNKTRILWKNRICCCILSKRMKKIQLPKSLVLGVVYYLVYSQEDEIVLGVVYYMEYSQEDELVLGVVYYLEYSQEDELA